MKDGQKQITQSADVLHAEDDAIFRQLYKVHPVGAFAGQVVFLFKIENAAAPKFRRRKVFATHTGFARESIGLPKQYGPLLVGS